jgi:hypothetical protein
VCHAGGVVDTQGRKTIQWLPQQGHRTRTRGTPMSNHRVIKITDIGKGPGQRHTTLLSQRNLSEESWFHPLPETPLPDINFSTSGPQRQWPYKGTVELGLPEPSHGARWSCLGQGSPKRGRTRSHLKGGPKKGLGTGRHFCLCGADPREVPGRRIEVNK